MADRKKELKTIRKTVRLSPATVALIERKSTKSNKPFSEVVRRAIIKDLGKRKKAKEK